MQFAATWMQLEIIILSEESQDEKGKWYHIWYQSDMESEIWHIGIENRFVAATWSGEGEDELGFWC